MVMAPRNGDTPAAAPAGGIHQGREACRSLLRQALLGLGAGPALGDPPRDPPRERPREAWLVDRQFGDWPLDEAAVIDSLSAWLRPGGRRLQLIGLDFDGSARALPRFARWRRDWSHRIEVHRPVDGLLPASLRGLHAGGVAWQWLDAPDWRLGVLSDPMPVRSLREQIADFLQRCEPSWPVTTLGL